MGVVVEAEFAYQAFAALLHCRLYRRIYFRIRDTFVYGLISLPLSEICGDRVSGIEGKELALYVGEQVVGKVHTLDLRRPSNERLLLDIPFVEVLHHDVDRILAAYRRNNAVNRAVCEAHVAVGPGGCFSVEQGVGEFLELACRPDCVLACDYVERGFHACRLSCGYAFRYRRSHESEYAYADGCRNHFGIHYLIDNLL